MKTIFISLFALFFWSKNTAFAQQALLTDIKGDVVMKTTYTQINGSPYIFSSDWLNGYVVNAFGKKYEQLQIRFDAYQHELEYNKKEGAIVIDKDNYKEFLLEEGDKKHLFRAFVIDKKNVFCELLHEGKYQFLIHHKVSLHQQKAFNSAVTEKNFEVQKTYYLFFEQKAIKIKLNKNSILEALPHQSKRIEEFGKEQKSKFKTEQEVLNLLLFLEK